MRIDEFEGRSPRLVLEDFFEGRTQAWGLIEDRFGRLRGQFKARVEGERSDDGLRLDEHFSYDDGRRDQRTWLLRSLGDGRYEGRTQDLVGTAQGRVVGSAFHWRYRMRLPIGGHRLVASFDDWMFLQEDGVLINRARVAKLGVTLAQVTILFSKQAIEAKQLLAAAE